MRVGIKEKREKECGQEDGAESDQGEDGGGAAQDAAEKARAAGDGRRGGGHGLGFETDPRVEPGVGDIDEEVQGDEKDAVNDDDPAQKEDVAV